MSWTPLNQKLHCITPSKILLKGHGRPFWELAAVAQELKIVSYFSVDRCSAWHGGLALGWLSDCQVAF